MSVPKSQRGDSEMEFIYAARQLEIYTIRKCVGMPKRYTFYIAQPLVSDARRIHDDVKMANSIFPRNQHDAQVRRDYLMRANAELYAMISQLEIAREIIGIDGKVMGYWAELVAREIRLIKAVMKRDQERFSKLE